MAAERQCARALGLLAAAVVASGCGDGLTADLRPTCSPEQPFGKLRRIAELNDVARKVHCARLSPDELVVYFSAHDDAGNADIFTARRPSRRAPFGRAEPIAEVNYSGVDLCASLTADGLALYMESGREDPQGAKSALFGAMRPSVREPFPSPTPIGAFAGSNSGGAYVTPGGEALYFHSFGLGSLGCADIYRAPRVGDGLSFGQPVALEIASQDCEMAPAVSADELTLYYSSDRAMPGRQLVDLFVSTRSSRDSAFPPGQPLDELNQPDVGEYVSWISPDACRLYVTVLDTDPATGWSAIHVAERGP